MPVYKDRITVDRRSLKDHTICPAMGTIRIRTGFGSVRCNDGVSAVSVLIGTGQTVTLKVFTVVLQFTAYFSAFRYKTDLAVFFYTEIAICTQTSAAAEVTETEAPAATGGSKEEILPLLQSASALAEADAAANKAAILTLLTQAKEKAEGSYPDAASVIGGAITLLDTDSPDGASVLALLNSATTILG